MQSRGWLTFKADYHILSNSSRANGIIDWMARNFISREANVLLKIHKTLIKLYLEYYTQAGVPLCRHENWRVILRLEGFQRIVTKLIKRVKDYNYRERLEKLGLTILLERTMEDNLMETFKIIYGIFHYD